jgi:hypothetical protein
MISLPVLTTSDIDWLGSDNLWESEYEESPSHKLLKTAMPNEAVYGTLTCNCCLIYLPPLLPSRVVHWSMRRRSLLRRCGGVVLMQERGFVETDGVKALSHSPSTRIAQNSESMCTTTELIPRPEDSPVFRTSCFSKDQNRGYKSEFAGKKSAFNVFFLCPLGGKDNYWSAELC